MTIDGNDPRWTAYILGELDAEERQAFEAEIAGDPTAEETLAEVRQSVSIIEDAFALGSPPHLTEAQRDTILAQAPQPVTARSHNGRWMLAAGLAASVLIGVVTLHVVRDVPDRAGADTFTQAAEQTTGQAVAQAPAQTFEQEARGDTAVLQTSEETTEADVAQSAADRDDAEFRIAERAQSNGTVGQVLPDYRVLELPLVDTDVADLVKSLEVTPESEPAPATAPTVQQANNTNAVDAGRVPAGRIGGISTGVLGGALAAGANLRGTVAPPPPAPAGPPPVPARFADQSRQQFNTEEYARINDNKFLAVSEEPLSTFSIDVDTASYANVRRFLNQRTLPPPDAVRIEEMINYFRYDYAPPVDGRPVRIHTEVASAPWAPDHRLVRIGIQGEEIERTSQASNLVFLIDVSGSMESPDKLPLLVDGMQLLVQQLGENDRVAIVVYAGASGLVLDSTPGFRKERIMSALDRLRAGGSTNGAAGIQLAYDVAVRNFIDGGVNRVILATDGDFNIGVTNSGDLTRLIEERAKTGVFLSVLGFGTGNLSDARLEALADRGNGNYSYIDSIREARKVLVEEIGSTLVTIAKDVKIQVEFNPAEVTAYRLIGYENRALENQDFNDDTVDAGEIGSGHTVTALFEIVPVGVPIDLPGVDPLRYQSAAVPSDQARSGELLTVAVRYKEPDGDESRLIEAPVVDRDQTFENASTDQRFAAAVAGFGMLLRDSPYKGSTTFDSVLRIGEASQGADAGGYRQEFLELVRRARALEDLN
jgi:Ca-activated chloride channel homolog